MDNKINANPTKEFFISMLTRDIDVKAAILELIDNSIDGAKRIALEDKNCNLKIDINYDNKSFSIQDNCGGISIDTAQNYAFRFGRTKDRPVDEGNFTGIFGIGMKRALFRLGNHFEIQSSTKNEFFSMEVDIPTWLADDNQDWSFSFSEVKSGLNNDILSTGTKIVVTGLHSGIQQEFALQTFTNNLIQYIKKYKTLIYEYNLTITINGVKLLADEDENTIIKSPIVTPYVINRQLGDIKVTILAGVAPKGDPKKAGWYIYCNGRVVVYADKTATTGWGEEFRLYHPSLAYFRGYVFFESSKLEQLPWNTTKTSIDTSSKVYISIKKYMSEAFNQIVSTYSQLITDENDEDIEEQILDKRYIKCINFSTLPELIAKNSSFEIVIEKEEKIPVTTISFKVEVVKANEAKVRLKSKSNKELGEKLFDYYYKREIDEC